ncbi:MAG: phosphoribosyltransferase family protein [Pseudomonadota bacterium]
MRDDMTSKRLAAKHRMRVMADFVWPRKSMVSGDRVAGAISAEDWTQLNFITRPICYQCGVPQPVELDDRERCASCTANPPLWTRGRAALAYDDASRRPILSLKRAGRRDGLAVLANWMIHAGRPLLDETDYLIPIPLHMTRLAHRGFNQAGWLASAIGRQSGTRVIADGLIRKRRTGSQEGLSVLQRAENVRNAFLVPSRHTDCVRNSRIVLIDDVFTTGATVTAATRALNRAGARNVDVLVLARVLRETQI